MHYSSSNPTQKNIQFGTGTHQARPCNIPISKKSQDLKLLLLRKGEIKLLWSCVFFETTYQCLPCLSGQCVRWLLFLICSQTSGKQKDVYHSKLARPRFFKRTVFVKHGTFCFEVIRERTNFCWIWHIVKNPCSRNYLLSGS